MNNSFQINAKDSVLFRASVINQTLCQTLSESRYRKNKARSKSYLNESEQDIHYKLNCNKQIVKFLYPPTT